MSTHPKWTRVAAGLYEFTDDAGNVLEVVNYQHYTGRPSREWNLIINGEAVEVFGSLREAKDEGRFLWLRADRMLHAELPRHWK